MNRPIYLPAWSGVAAGQTATLDCPIGPRYKELSNVVSDTAGGAITTVVDEFRVLVNGKPQRTFTPAEAIYIFDLYSENGTRFGTVNAGTNTTPGNAGYQAILPIYFREPWWKELAHQEAFSWGTGNLGSFQVEADINAAAAGAALYSMAEVDQSIVQVNSKPVQQPLGKIAKWYRNQFQVTGVTQKLKLPFKLPNEDFIQAIHLFDANVSSVILRNNSYVLFERTKQENDSELLRAGLTPDASHYSLVFDKDDMPDNALPMNQINGIPVTDLSIQLDLSDGTPRNINVVYEVIGLPD